jgi:hypothetical protein
MLSVIYEPFMLSVVMLYAIMLSVVAPLKQQLAERPRQPIHLTGVFPPVCC